MKNFRLKPPVPLVLLLSIISSPLYATDVQDNIESIVPDLTDTQDTLDANQSQNTSELDKDKKNNLEDNKDKNKTSTEEKPNKDLDKNQKKNGIKSSGDQSTGKDLSNNSSELINGKANSTSSVIKASEPINAGNTHAQSNYQLDQDDDNKIDEDFSSQNSKISSQIVNLQKAQDQIKKHEEFILNLPDSVKKELDNFSVKMNQVTTQKKELESKLSTEAKDFFIKERQYKTKIALITHNKSDNNKLISVKEIIEDYKQYLQNLSPEVKREVDEYRMKNAELHKAKLDNLNILSSKAKGVLKRERIMKKTISYAVTGKEAKSMNKRSKKNN